LRFSNQNAVFVFHLRALHWQYWSTGFLNVFQPYLNVYATFWLKHYPLSRWMFPNPCNMSFRGTQFGKRWSSWVSEWLHGRGSEGIFSFLHRVQTCSGAYLASCPLSNGGRSLVAKRLGHEADRSLHLVPSLRMRGAILPLPKYVFMSRCLIKWGYVVMVCYLVKHRDNCTLLITGWTMGVRFPARAEKFPSSTMFSVSLEHSHPCVYLVSGFLFPGTKRPEREIFI
jgi:hypothetical protein